MTPSPASSLVLIGIGGAGSLAARGVHRAYGGGLRVLTVDGDIAPGSEVC